MRGGRLVRWCGLSVSGVLLAGCGRASHQDGAAGAGGALDSSSGGGGRTGSSVAGRATSGGGGRTVVDEVGGVAGEPSTVEAGGHGGAAPEGPLSWELELTIIDPIPKHLEQAAQAGTRANSGAIALSEDGARALGHSSFVPPEGSGGGRHDSELFTWTKELGSVSLGTLGELEPAINTDTGGLLDIIYQDLDFTTDLKVVVGSVNGSAVAHAFLWRDGVGMTELELPGAPVTVTCRVSADGQVVLVVATDPDRLQQRTFRFDSSGRSELGTLDGFDAMSAASVTADGRVVGMASKNNCAASCSQPFSWLPGEDPQAFELPPGARDCLVTSPERGSRSIALDCAVDAPPGRVVWSEGLGWQTLPGAPNSGNSVSFLAQDGSAAFVRSNQSYPDARLWHWDSTTSATPLPLPEDWRLNWVHALSDDATAALIEAEDAGYIRSTLRWTVGSELLVVSSPNGGKLWASSMSGDATRITGYAGGVGETSVLWLDGRAYFLVELLTRAGIDLTGIELTGAGVSRDGRILSGGAVIDGAYRGWLTHLPE